MGALIIPVTDVSAQKVLPQNIFCIMTVDNTIACHETEQACELVEDQQQSITQMMDPEVSPTCSSFTGNIAGMLSSDFDFDREASNTNEPDNDNDENEVDNDATTIQDTPINPCEHGCVNQGDDHQGTQNEQSEDNQQSNDLETGDNEASTDQSGDNEEGEED